jgi:hypothetical protein
MDPIWDEEGSLERQEGITACFGPEEEPGHDSRDKEAFSPTNWEMIYFS